MPVNNQIIFTSNVNFDETKRPLIIVFFICKFLCFLVLMKYSANYYAVNVYVSYLVTLSNSDTLQDSFGAAIRRETRKKSFFSSLFVKNQICACNILQIVTISNTTFYLWRGNFFIILRLFSHNTSNHRNHFNCNTIHQHSKFSNFTSTLRTKSKVIFSHHYNYYIC